MRIEEANIYEYTIKYNGPDIPTMTYRFVMACSSARKMSFALQMGFGVKRLCLNILR